MTAFRQLYLIPVPISADTEPAQILPPVVIEIVKKLRCFFVEDLRSARRFLKAVDRNFEIDACEFHILDEHTTEKDIEVLEQVLSVVHEAGVISEAGCPAIADPGALIVEAARRRGFLISPLVGPSSIILGLMASGFNGQDFAFNGYLPHDNQQRKKKLQEFQRLITLRQQTQIFIETPYRNNKLIELLCAEMPHSLHLCVACDITSPSESIIVKSLGEWKTSHYDYSKRPAIFLMNQ